jgi:hypothetical protein
MVPCLLLVALSFPGSPGLQQSEARLAAAAYPGLGDGEGVVLPVGSSVDVVLHGFARVDYGAGERFGDASGDDQFGISKMALVTETSWNDFTFVGVIGATILADQPVDTELKDIFVTWRQLGGTRACARFGAEPLLFGLKPAGYPGDRTIVPSLEFGGAGAFAVSNQAGTAFVLDYPLEGVGTLQGGVFDTDATTSGAPGSLEGSGIYKNYFGQLRLEGLAGIEGLYGVVGYEGRYVGQTSAGARVDETEPVFDVGLGYRTERFDLSVEYIAMDEMLTETPDTESYLIGELTVFVGEWSLLADFATAAELEADTLRVGAAKSMNEHVSLQFEFAHDSLDSAEDVDSVHARLAFTF